MLSKVKVTALNYRTLTEMEALGESYDPCLQDVKGDLDGTIFSYDCRMRFLERALLASCKNRTQLSPLNIAFTYDCRRILKHVLKSYDIFRVVCVYRKDVVG